MSERSESIMFDEIRLKERSESMFDDTRLKERGFSHAFARTFETEISPWSLCHPAPDFPIYVVRHGNPSLDHDQSPQPARGGRFEVQSGRDWTPSATESDDLRLELAVIPILTHGDESNQGLHFSGPEDVLKRIFRDMRIPTAVLSCFLTNRTQFTVFPTETPCASVTLLNFRQWAIAWHFDPTSNRTKAMILWRYGARDKWTKIEVADHVQNFLEDIIPTYANQYSVGILGVLLCARQVASSLSHIDNEAYYIERRLRLLKDVEDLQDAAELDYLSATHNRLASRTVRERSRASVALSYLEFLMKDTDPPTQPEEERIHASDLKSLHLLTQSLITHAAKALDDANINLSYLYNHISQRDAAINLQVATASREIALQSKIDQTNSLAIADASKRIAEDARRDSSAMKMVAVVTMVYLPGTFVATCFSMEIFQWSAPAASDVVSPRIWLYFLFTAVLTIVTIGSYATWIWRQERLGNKFGPDLVDGQLANPTVTAMAAAAPPAPVPAPELEQIPAEALRQHMSQVVNRMDRVSRSVPV